MPERASATAAGVEGRQAGAKQGGGMWRRQGTKAYAKVDYDVERIPAPLRTAQDLYVLNCA